ncbi:MAG: glutamine--fructose-6-phosphate transaminase (isomerizing), partial [Leptospiraceae bacterium]|nr:glutamine--fructose-6-phosphate transaminase (isomerizing) [Leptospiraceae bacterium]
RIGMKGEGLDKGGFDQFMLKGSFEQSGVMGGIINERIAEGGKVVFGEKNNSNEFLSRLSRIIITSAGTSWHAGLVGKAYLERFAKISTEVDLSSEFRYRNPVAEGDTKVLAISQSGETADTIASIYEAKAKFIRVLSFVNNTSSTIARESNSFIDLKAGPEIGVASTKAYTAQLMNLLLYALFLAGVKWILDKDERMRIFDEIRRIPDQIDQILSRADVIRQWAADFRETKDFVFLGRSFNYPTALEGALKLKEVSYIHASGYAGGEFKHGPIALITDEVPVVCITPQGEIYEKMISNIEEVRARKGKIISIHTEGDEKVPGMSDYSFGIPQCSELISPILAVIPLQLLAYYVAVERGCEPDQPRNLAKSVTVE